MRTAGNLIWLLFGGFYAAVFYCIGGLALCLTVIGIPFGLQCFKLAGFVLWPFGKTVVGTSSGSGCLVTILNIVWLLMGGLWLALGHLFFGCLLLLTVIGIPFARQHFKMIEI